jgi:cyclophilin family peptidyl-prolyl cis-trans isomerase/HEAT repeat protein
MHTARLACVLLVAAIAPGTALAQRATAIGSQRGRQPEQQRVRDLTRRAILEIEDARAPTVADLRTLIDAARLQDPQLRVLAVRALGRLERRDVIADLLPYLNEAPTRAEAANALAQALGGPMLRDAVLGQQEQVVLDALLAAGATELTSKAALALSPLARSVGRLPFTSAEQIEAAENFLRRILDTPFPQAADEPHVGAARGLESLARLHRKTHQLDDLTVERLREYARSTHPARADRRRNALLALVAAQRIDGDTIEAVRTLEPELRRLAASSLGGAGLQIPDDDRIRWLRELLRDRSAMVRLEAVRAWARRAAPLHGCLPLVDRLADDDLQVALMAIDVLGEACADDTAITGRLSSIAGGGSVDGRWQREAHAFVALARRAPDQATPRVPQMVRHRTWQVRMYAARAAAILGDVQALAALADDPDDNVVEAALPPLRQRAGRESDPQFVAALSRRTRIVDGHAERPYQVIRAAAIALQGAESTAALVGALGDAIERITDERCETSRDTRLALIARLGELGSPDRVGVLVPLLADFDPLVAQAAAAIVATWTARLVQTDVPPRLVTALPAEAVAALDRSSVLVEMETGKTFELRFTGDAPLTRARFLALVRQGYYDNRTFHRVAPNFVIQGGSPNANEYCGDCPFARDELGLAMHTRGTAGISTRGRDTGDMQIFVNLVDSPRLDHDYTVFAQVCVDAQKDGMETVDAIQEGDRMRRVTVIQSETACYTDR